MCLETRILVNNLIDCHKTAVSCHCVKYKQISHEIVFVVFNEHDEVTLVLQVELDVWLDVTLALHNFRAISKSNYSCSQIILFSLGLPLKGVGSSL